MQDIGEENCSTDREEGEGEQDSAIQEEAALADHGDCVKQREHSSFPEENGSAEKLLK